MTYDAERPPDASRDSSNRFGEAPAASNLLLARCSVLIRGLLRITMYVCACIDVLSPYWVDDGLLPAQAQVAI